MGKLSRHGPRLRRKKPLRAVSAKQAKALRLYRELRTEFLAANGRCQFPACNAAASDVHHKARRGSNLNNVASWLAVCRHHHCWIELNANASRAMGLIA